MPVPIIEQVRASNVKSSDDLLVDEVTKETSEHGMPYPIAFVDQGDKWIYINLSEPIGRRRVFKYSWSDMVWRVRLEDTAEEKLAKVCAAIAGRALSDQKNHWLIRIAMAEALASGVKEESVWSRSPGLRQVPMNEALNRLTTQLAEEFKVGLWHQCHVLMSTQGIDALNALVDVRNKIRTEILEEMTDGPYIRAARSWLDSTDRYENGS